MPAKDGDHAGNLNQIGLINPSASVQDKIRKWQTAGGGVLVQDDVIAGDSDKDGKSDVKSDARSEKRGEAKSDRKSEAKSATAKSRDSSRARSKMDAPPEPKTPSQVSKKSAEVAPAEQDVPAEAAESPAEAAPAIKMVERKAKGNALDDDVKRATTPKKRVVSDAHWRRKHAGPAVKAPPPQKAEPEKKETYAWVRPPLLARPAQDGSKSPPKATSPGKEFRIYSGKLRGRSYGPQEALIDLVAAGASHLSKRPVNSVPMKTPGYSNLSKRPVTSLPISLPTTPRPKDFQIEVEYETESDPEPRLQSSRRRRSTANASNMLDPYESVEERRKLRRRRQQAPEIEPHISNNRSDRRATSVDDELRYSNRKSSVQAPSDPESAGEEKRRRRRKRRAASAENEPTPLYMPPSPPRELNNYDNEAEQRRADARKEFAAYEPPRQRRSHRRRSSRRYSFSPEAVERIPDPVPREAEREPPPQRQSSNRIEAWLTATPDHTDGGEKRSAKAESRFSGRAKTENSSSSFQSSAGDTATQSTADTESTITDSTMTGPQRARRPDYRVPNSMKPSTKGRASRVFSESHIRSAATRDAEVQYASTYASTPTLRRSGARHASSSNRPRARSILSATTSTFTDMSLTESTITETTITDSTITDSTITDSTITDSDLTSSRMSSSVDPRGFDKPGERAAVNIAKRLFPSTGKRLSTIASVDTLGTAKAPDATSQSNKAELKEAIAGAGEGSVVSAARSGNTLKRKLTSHADLMTVLSMPASRSKSIVSARSIRTHRSRLETATVEDLMRELASDETKYMRELRTLADGVIPILLKCVLSKSEAAVAAGLFKTSPGDEKQAISEASKAIHDMSVAIQRLKSLHTRIPKENHFSLLIWAQSACSVYEKYIKTWRLGFQDVVVNLADKEGSAVSAGNSEAGTWDGMPRNEEGYIVDGDGERVDVAFLLKRPFVRLKYLSKTMKGISMKKPSEQAEVLAKKFDKLMELARAKIDDEKARIEDEAAALIDPTRARDPKSLAPLSGVKIDATRCVKARDYFDLHLPHSSGQTMDCRVELLCRDDAPGRGTSGDILICEVEENSRWLLFPPIEMKRISARVGDEPGELVLMIRGVSSGGSEWDEVFTLTTSDEEVRFEWIQWLGLEPIPPALSHKRSFKTPTVVSAKSNASSSLLSTSERTASTAPPKSRTPSPREIDVPIGEKASSASKRWNKDSPIPNYDGSDVSSLVSTVLDSERATLYYKKPRPAQSVASTNTYTSTSSFAEDVSAVEDFANDASSKHRTTPRNLNEAMAMAGTDTPTKRRARPARYRPSPSADPTYKQPQALNVRSTASAQYESRSAPITPVAEGKSTRRTTHDGGFSVWIPNSEADSDSDRSSDENGHATSSYVSGRPRRHYRTASVPSLHLASLPRAGSSSKHEYDPDEYMSGALQPEPLKTPSRPGIAKVPASGPAELAQSEDKPPPPPPHRTPSSQQPKLTPTSQRTPGSNVRRRPSSPLKHEYKPSSPSTPSSYTQSDSLSDLSEDSISSLSDDLSEADDVASTFVPSEIAPQPPKHDFYSIPNSTIKPSESASQAPYRTVPHVVTTEAKPSKCIASIFTWSMKGQWELLHQDDCSIGITPGLIAAYTMGPHHATDRLPEERPLIAQELTPLVPLRRGTALDITIRSPPTQASKLRPSPNIMFRSRSAEECDALYTLINHARIHNPTYIALQNARPPTATDSWAVAMDRRNSLRDNPSASPPAAGVAWFGSGFSRSKSYRASSRAHSTAGNTESSIGTLSSVLTAMRRFSGSSFPSHKSRPSASLTDSTGSASADGGAAGAGATRPAFVPPGSGGAQNGDAASISNFKIRLYVLRGKNRWQDLGSSKLAVLGKQEGGPIAAPIMLHTGMEKRVRVTKRGRGLGGVVMGNAETGEEGDVLLDVTLPEMCFERWARTGVGVSVWVDVVAPGAGASANPGNAPGAAGEGGGGVAKTGGVTEKRVVKYMFQLKNERECAYVFSLLGKLRY